MTIQYLPSRGRSSRISFAIDEKDVARVKQKLERASGKSLYVRMQRATLAAGDIVAKNARAAAPRRTGLLRRSVKSRLERRKGFGARGSSLTVLVGPTSRAPHRHLIILGHRIVTPGGRYTGRRTPPNPFVRRAASGVERQAAELIRREWRALL